MRIKPAEILYLQADGNYVEIHMDTGRLVLRNSMAELLKMLPGFLLHQVNRSQAVNVQRLDLIGHDTVQIGQHTLTLSKHFRDMLLDCISVLSGR
ncbi:MAG: LytTR family transcriptional regulator [Bacteroidetes bacterium]|nr:LytTR family transcriptional regulator [Bacteroidota bacterium]